MKEIFLIDVTSKLGSKIPLSEGYTRQNKVKSTSYLLLRLCRFEYWIFFKFYFYFILLYNTVLVLPYLTWISHGCTWVPNLEPPSHFPPHIISLDHPHAPAPSILYPVSNTDWRFVIIWQYTCFNAILPNHPTLSLSLWVQKSAIHICVFFAVLHTGSSLLSF